MRKETKFAIFDFEKEDADLIDYLASYLDNNAKVALDFFEVKVPKEKIHIKIMPTKKEYDEYYKVLYALPKDTKLKGWMVGTYNFEKNQIVYLSLHDFKSTTQSLKDAPFDEALIDYQKTILHEYVHYANGLFRKKYNCSYPEKYLSEGIATYLSGQYDASTLNFDFEIEDVLDNNKNIYYSYYILTKYLVENYKKDYVLEVFKSSDASKKLLEDELFKNAKRNFNCKNL